MLRSRRPDLVIQELYGLLLAHFAIRSLMHEAALEHKRDPDAAHADRTGDGYTNLEEYLHRAHEQVLGRYGAGAGRQARTNGASREK